MKKLLAMILCVVMVLSLAPMAFADASGTTGGLADDYTYDRWPSYMSTVDAKRTITDLGKDMKAMYYAITADETVFGAAQGIYSMTDSLAKELLKDVEKFTTPSGREIYQEDLIANVRKGLNHIIGNEISNYMNDRISAYTDSTGHVQPEKYLNTFIAALNSTLSSAKGQKNIEALIYGLAALNLQKSVNDRADDLYDAIIDWDHWKEFYWTTTPVTDEDGNFVGIAAANVQDPDPAAGNGGYVNTWLPTQGWNNTVLIPTQSAHFLTDDWATGGSLAEGALPFLVLNGALD
jgi:hypothetical protein